MRRPVASRGAAGGADGAGGAQRAAAAGSDGGFLANHFNVFVAKGELRWYTTAWERDVIRPHALGRFPELLRASARHPAMLFYLDNWLSARPDVTLRLGPGAGRRAGSTRTTRAS
jgi:hypothetical protein